MSDTGPSSPSADPLDALYYVQQGQEVVGPVNGTAVKVMVENGSLNARSSINKVGEPNWVEASQFGFLAGSFRTAPLPAPTIGEGEYVGFGPRLAAYLIDAVFVYIIVLVISFILGLFVGVSLTAMQSDQDTIQAVASIVGGLVGLVVAICYFGGFLASKWQATPGKRILGIYVIRTDRRPVGWLLGTGRYFAYILSSVILWVGFLMILWTDEKKALHDIICKTRVVRGRPVLRANLIDAF